MPKSDGRGRRKQFLLDQEIVDALEQKAFDLRRSQSSIVREALRSHLAIDDDDEQDT